MASPQLGQLRGDATTNIPVVAVTASVTPNEREKVLAAGFNAYIGKPIDVDAFGEDRRFVPKEAKAERQAAHPRRGRQPTEREAVEQLLKSSGYEVVSALSGARRSRSWKLPHRISSCSTWSCRMSGYEVCRAIRANPGTALLPVVMVTALDPAEERVKGIEAGADDFLSKPINQAEILARVKSLLRIRALHRKVEDQAQQLTEWNAKLEERVAAQVAQLDRLARLKRFLAQVAELIVEGSTIRCSPSQGGRGRLRRPARIHRFHGNG
jgi:DNA-binding response OmpR family regulator